MGQNKTSPPLYRELSRLSPDIFSHTVWAHYIPPDHNSIAQLIQILQTQIHQLITDNDPNSACQVLFLCAALEKLRGDYSAALAFIQLAGGLAKQHNLAEVAGWAAWGACALFTLSGQYEPALNNLRWLRNNLTDVNDWVVIDLLEILEPALYNPTGGENGYLGELFERLMKWGDPDWLSQLSPKIEAQPETSKKIIPEYDKRTLLSRKWWRAIWLTIKQIARSDLQPKTEAQVKRSVEKRKISVSQENLSNLPILCFQSSDLETIQPGQPDEPLSTGSEATSHIEKPAGHLDTLEKTLGETALTIFCLGPFRVFVNDQLIMNWPSGKGKAIFKYMLAKDGRPVSKDILMDTFWRNTEIEAARKNLYVAIHGLRQAFRAVEPEFSCILFWDDHYFLNPDISIWTDFREFLQRFQAGQRFDLRRSIVEAVREYETAESLYHGDFLEEDLYEDWLIPFREGLKDNYFIVLERLSRSYLEERRYGICIQYCQKILAKDNCREDAHQRLMRCYSRQGQRTLALRQYHFCMEALQRELGVSPMPETTALYNQVREGQVV